MSKYLNVGLLFFFIFLGFPGPATAKDGTERFLQAIDAIDSAGMLKNVEKLSGPNFEGRQAGTPGGRRSAFFVGKEFARLRLQPAGNEQLLSQSEAWFQQAPTLATQFLSSTTLEFFSLDVLEGNHVLPMQLGPDYLPVLDSPAVALLSKVVFVGYGLSDPAHGVDDYEGINVRDRVVMFLRGKPPSYPVWVTHADKEQIAREKGAVAFTTLTGPTLSPYEARRGMGHEPLAFYTNSLHERVLPGTWISTDAGKKIFQLKDLDLQNVQESLNKGFSDQSQDLPVLVRLRWQNIQRPEKLVNVLGMIQGQDPTLQEETVIIGAHRDHFGKQAGLIFPGADDNASGTAVLLEVARIMATVKQRPSRTILFISFSGEEQGLRGARFYTRFPARSLNKTIVMINVDHVGVGNGKLTVGVSKLPRPLAQQAANQVGLQEMVQLYGYFPGGDHVPFAEANIPTIAVVSSGIHPSFHQSTDTPEKIEPPILEMAARYVLSLTWLLANPSPD